MEVSPAGREPSAARRWRRLRTREAASSRRQDRSGGAAAASAAAHTCCAFELHFRFGAPYVFILPLQQTILLASTFCTGPAYNRALCDRESLTVYLGSDLERKWGAPLASGERGQPLVSPAAVITLGEVLDLAQPPPGTVVIGDGDYERRLCYAAAKRHRVTLISPPSKRAVLHPGEDWIERNHAN